MNDYPISMKKLIEAIEASKTDVEVCVPSEDYYRGQDSWTRTKITYVDPRKLLQALGVPK